jgi:aminoglycoside phosphotransferase (APT) family kinase protein
MDESTATPGDFLELLRHDGVAGPEATLVPLAGGVSSDIYRLEEPGRAPRAVKRALAQLRVRDAWLADLSRNLYEQRYLRYVGQLWPACVPAILASGDGYFVMEYLGAGFVNWKSELLQGRVDVAPAAEAGRILGRIHAHARRDSTARERFDSTDNFWQLRIDPYFLTAAQRHPDVAPQIVATAEELAAVRDTLVHGDFSPKNMLLGPDRLVLLDCEVAWFGDGAFDVAFLLSHLLLKAAHFAPRDLGAKALCDAFLQRYFGDAALDAAAQTAFADRCARLTTLLLLARIDGKSPVEYLVELKRAFVRRTTLDWLRGAPTPALADLPSAWQALLAAAFPPASDDLPHAH